MFKILICIASIFFVGCNEFANFGSNAKTSHDAKLISTNEGWYLDGIHLSKLLELEKQLKLSPIENLLLVSCYNVDFEKVASTLDLMKKLKIDSFSLVTEQSEAVCK